MLFLLVYAINLNTFEYEVFNNCNSYTPKIATERMMEALTAQKALGAKCDKVPDIISYSCSFSNKTLANKLIAIELHKNKNDCIAVPEKTAKQMNFLMK